MSADSLHALLLSADRMLLRRLTRLLESVGSRVDQLAEVDRVEPLLAATRPDFVIVDTDLPAGTLQSICRTAVDDLETGPPPVILALVARHESSRVADALAGGAHDVLHKPLVPGEVLARLRAAARLREQLWRRHMQLGNSETLGCLPPPAWRALAAEVARQRSGIGACVVVHLDHLHDHAISQGRVFAARLRAEVIERLQAAGGDEVVWGELEDNSFAALLTSSDDVAALAWAERLRAAVAERPLELDGQSIRITASMGIAQLGGSEALAEEQARGAMQLARSSGRNCVVSAAEWQNERRRQEDEPSWLDSANAWDVMIPHPLALFPEDTVEQAVALMTQTQLAHIPVVDGAGKLVGLVSARSVQTGERKTAPRGSGSVRFVRAVMQSAPTQFEEDTPVRKMQAFFATDPSPVAVVTRQGRPLGLVYSHSLAAMQEQLTRSTFASHSPFSLDSSYLTTPDGCAVDDS